MSESKPSPPSEAAFFATIRSWGLTRGDHGIVGGVVEGVGDRIGLARVPARLIFVVLTLFTGGLGLLAYAAGWALLPDRRGNIIVQNFGRGVTNVGALLGIALLTVLGLGGLPDGLRRLAPWSWSDGWPWDDGWGVLDTLGMLWWFLIVGGITWLVIVLIQRSRSGEPGIAAQPGPARPPAPGAPPAPTEPVYAALPGEAGPSAQAGQTPPAAAAAAAAGAASAAATDAERQAWQAQQQAQHEAWQAQQAAQQQAQQQAWEAQRQAQEAAAAARRQRVIPGPGAAGYLTALAWLILSGVGVWVAARNDLLAVHPWVAWPVAVLIGWGAILMVVSLLGRRLGFLGVLTVLGIVPVLLIGSLSGSLREHWADDGGILPHWEIDDEAELEANIKSEIEGWIQENIDPDFDIDEAEGTTEDSTSDPEPDSTATIAPLAVFDDYEDVLLRGDCYDASLIETRSDGEVEHLAIGTLSADREVTLGTAVTSLTVPEGTQLRIVTEDEQSLEVEWADRNLWCEVAGDDATVVALGDAAEQPTLTLVAASGTDLIVINEIEE